VRLGEGDTFFLFTDGLTEARNYANAEYGESRLAKLLAALRERPNCWLPYAKAGRRLDLRDQGCPCVTDMVSEMMLMALA
jgi:hypothetical protein